MTLSTIPPNIRQELRREYYDLWRDTASYYSFLVFVYGLKLVSNEYDPVMIVDFPSEEEELMFFMRFG